MTLVWTAEHLAPYPGHASRPPRLCFEAFTENMAGESQLLEARRQYHCAAYNCAIAVISRSFSEAKFYQGFLFSEKPEKVGGPGAQRPSV